MTVNRYFKFISKVNNLITRIRQKQQILLRVLFAGTAESLFFFIKFDSRLIIYSRVQVCERRVKIVSIKSSENARRTEHTRTETNEKGKKNAAKGARTRLKIRDDDVARRCVRSTGKYRFRKSEAARPAPNGAHAQFCAIITRPHRRTTRERLFSPPPHFFFFYDILVRGFFFCDKRKKKRIFAIRSDGRKRLSSSHVSDTWISVSSVVVSNKGGIPLSEWCTIVLVRLDRFVTDFN